MAPTVRLTVLFYFYANEMAAIYFLAAIFLIFAFKKVFRLIDFVID
jgi:hypothetical protein